MRKRKKKGKVQKAFLKFKVRFLRLSRAKPSFATRRKEKKKKEE